MIINYPNLSGNNSNKGWQIVLSFNFEYCAFTTISMSKNRIGHERDIILPQVKS